MNKLLKKIKYTILPIFLAVVMLMPMTVSATDGSEASELKTYPIAWQAETWHGYAGEELAQLLFNQAVNEYKFIDDWEYLSTHILVLCSSDNTVLSVIFANVSIYGDDTDLFYNDGDVVRFRQTSTGKAYHAYFFNGNFSDFDMYSLASWDKFNLPLGIGARVIYTSHDIYNSTETVAMWTDTPSSSEIEGEHGHYKPDKELGELDGHNKEINDKIQDEEILDEDTTSTDNVFLRIFQSLGSMTNNIGQMISNVAYYVETGFQELEDFLEDKLENVINSLADSIGSVLPQGLKDIISSIYQSGLDTSGKFSIGIFFEHWLIPRENYFSDSLSNVIDSVPVISSIVTAANTLYSVLSNLEAVAPVITIPPLTVGEFYFPGMNITFEWFAAWKPYTDAVLTVLIYYGFIIHLIKNLPNIISSTPSVPAGQDVPLQSNWEGGIYRK